MAKSTAKKASNIVMWFILGLLMLALAGFGVTSFGGAVRVVAQVGSEEVTTNEYARALQQEQVQLQQQTGQALTFADMQTFGFDRLVLERLVAQAALNNEAARLGVSVGDAEVARQIRSIPAFGGVDGSFDREGYTFALRNAGLNEREFERDVRAESARNILQTAVLGGVQPSETFSRLIARWRFETRNVTLATVTLADLEAGPLAPSDADLQTHYEENAAFFTEPEAREIRVAWATPDDLVDSIDVPEASLREVYEQRADQFRQPERVLAERLGFASTADAAAALASIAAGETTFDALVEDRGLTLEDVDQGEVSAADVSAPIAQALFALEEPGLVGPIDTDLGPAVFRVNAILSATEVPFEDLRDDLRGEFALDAARRALADEVTALEDLLAGGASLEELAAETDLSLETLVWRPGDTGGIAGYDAFQLAASVVQEGDFAEVLELSDGGIFALELVRIIPPTLPPLADIRDAVSASWVAQSNDARVLERAEAIAANPAALEDQDLLVETIEGLARDSFLDDVPPTVVERAFTLANGETMAVGAGGGVAYVVRVDAVIGADLSEDEAAQTVTALNAATRQGLAQDLFEAYGQAVQLEAELSVNQQAINAVHASIGAGHGGL